MVTAPAWRLLKDPCACLGPGVVAGYVLTCAVPVSIHDANQFLHKDGFCRLVLGCMGFKIIIQHFTHAVLQDRGTLRCNML